LERNKEKKKARRSGWVNPLEKAVARTGWSTARDAVKNEYPKGKWGQTQIRREFRWAEKNGNYAP